MPANTLQRVPLAMDRTERFYRIDQLLHEQGVVSRHSFMKELEVSLATFKRDLEYMRDRFNAPIAWEAARALRFPVFGSTSRRPSHS